MLAKKSSDFLFSKPLNISEHQEIFSKAVQQVVNTCIHLSG